MRVDPFLVEQLSRRRAGVVTTAELVARGADDAWIRRQVRSGRWQRMHRGVLLTHSGPVIWLARAWAAVAYAGEGAALTHRSAAQALRFRPPDDSGPVWVSVPPGRRVRPAEGLRLVHRRLELPTTLGLPVVVRAETAVDVVDTARTVDDAVGWLCDAVRAGTWPDRIAEAAARRTRLRRRAQLREWLAEVGDGVESPLEHRYHRDVERGHRLPAAVAQQRDRVDGRWIRADRVYDPFGVRVELDGSLAHPGGRTDSDTWRDNAVLVARGDMTLRYRWRPVAGAPCATASQVAAALRLRGWNGSAHPCGPSCTAVGAPR